MYSTREKVKVFPKFPGWQLRGAEGRAVSILSVLWSQIIVHHSNISAELFIYNILGFVSFVTLIEDGF